MMVYKFGDMGGERACPPNSMVLLTRLAKQVYRRSTEQLLGMHMRHLMTLSYLRDHTGCPQQELAEVLCMDANNVVLLLNELEDLGFIARKRIPEERFAKIHQSFERNEFWALMLPGMLPPPTR